MEFKNRQSIYMQISDYILENIISGFWSEEEKIPSVREMSEELRVNPNTVMRAYSRLQDSGIINNRRGIGFFVSPDSREMAINEKKQIFLNRELPEIFRKMYTLEIDFSEIENIYQKEKSVRGKHENK